MSWKKYHPLDPEGLRPFIEDYVKRMTDRGALTVPTEEESRKIRDAVHDEMMEELGEYFNSLKRVSFRIRRKYFDLIVKGIKTNEIRTDKPYWSWLLGDEPPLIATFVCGKDVHRRWIKRIFKDDPERVLGRQLSEQGRQDVLSNPAIIIELGTEYATNTAKEESS